MYIPKDTGSLTTKVVAGFKQLTADQWRMWSLVYSTVCLQTILPKEHFESWVHFVKAATAFCSKVITPHLCEYAHREAITFCRQYQHLYGDVECVPNMHYMCHLHECLQEFGPAAGIWLFPFERMNGILGDTHTNKRNIPQQLMAHFLSKKETLKLVHNLPDDLIGTFTLPDKRLSNGGRLSFNVISATKERLQLQLTHNNTFLQYTKSNSIPTDSIGKCTIDYLSTDAHKQLQTFIETLKPPSAIIVNRQISVYNSYSCCGITYQLHAKELYILAKPWITNSTERCRLLRGGKVTRIFECNISTDDNTTDFQVALAEVNWAKNTSKQPPYPWISITTSFTSTYIPFIPIASIISRAGTITKQNELYVLPVDFLLHDEQLELIQ